MEATICQSCQATLLSTTTTQDQLVRCGSCGSIFLPKMNNQVAIKKTDLMAKWSFWLGISSLLLCMVTGIPALILGLRSLRRMRFRPVQKREKFQAVTGTVMGLVFGVLGGGCLTTMGVTVAFFVSSFEMTKEPDRVAEIAATSLTFDNSLELKPVSAVSFLPVKIIFYADRRPPPKGAPRDEENEPSVIVTFIEFHFQPDASNVTKIMRDKFIGERGDYKIAFSDKADWRALGCEVSRDLFEDTDNPEKQILRYILLRKHEMSWFGASIVFDPEKSNLTDEDVKRMFQSIDVKIFHDSPDESDLDE